MRQFLSVNRSLRDARSLRDIAFYFLKYTPAACCVTYILQQQMQGRFSLAATFGMAAAMVLFGVEFRAATRRRSGSKGR